MVQSNKQGNSRINFQVNEMTSLIQEIKIKVLVVKNLEFQFEITRKILSKNMHIIYQIKALMKLYWNPEFHEKSQEFIREIMA